MSENEDKEWSLITLPRPQGHSHTPRGPGHVQKEQRDALSFRHPFIGQLRGVWHKCQPPCPLPAPPLGPAQCPCTLEAAHGQADGLCWPTRLPRTGSLSHRTSASPGLTPACSSCSAQSEPPQLSTKHKSESLTSEAEGTLCRPSCGLDKIQAVSMTGRGRTAQGLARD